MNNYKTFEELKEELGDKFEECMYEANIELLDKTEELRSKIYKAKNIAFKYGQEDGGHHKMWVIDQMLRELLKDDYETFVKEYEEPDEDGDYYEWDIGIAP